MSGGSDERLLGSAIRDYMLISGETLKNVRVLRLVRIFKEIARQGT